MGLMGTLAKVAIGYAAARGVDRMSGGAGLGGLLGGGAQLKARDPNAATQAQMAQPLSGQVPGGAANPMQGMLDMARQSTAGLGAGAPMATLLEKLQAGGIDLSHLAGRTPGGAGSGGLLSQLGSGGTGMAGLFAALGGAAAQAQGDGVARALDAVDTGDSAAEEAAALMLRAMIQAARADGEIDAAERARILETVGADADAEDRAFVEAQMAAPLDPEALAADTPEAQRMQVYSASLMTIRVDTEAEAQYLDRLARALSLDEPTVNALHMQMGLQPLYA
ncbi:tellurite resistance TerB family protein [Pseudoponticoccus marisrubri]|uniref:Protein YebE n=1 Tax=Pseudoponticoccus marisrubri TaxID=1685382 RepID=A0A0W7WPB7_9RHOB|nr:tellurite resistance TerB family protein [Pseudoponticoccus marisrubri]KUF12396.1 hypothetical protein AVJ23_01305 [Pseudoponticoccus marisrubri]